MCLINIVLVEVNGLNVSFLPEVHLEAHNLLIFI